MVMRRSAFTIPELIVIVIVVVLLLALGMPALNRSRAASRSSKCQDNLRKLGLGLLIHADRDSLTRYCTGAYDWYHDGCPDSVGWVADLVNMNLARPIDLLCPSNPMPGSEQLAELYSKSYQQTDPGNPDPQQATLGVCGAAAWDSPGTPGRAAAIEQYLLERGYDSNYTASWYLVRGGPKLSVAMFTDSQGEVARIEFHGIPMAGKPDWRSLANTIGPLRQVQVDKSKLPSSSVPLLGDGNRGHPASAVAPTALKYRKWSHVAKGDGLTASFNAGPATSDGTSISPMPIGSHFGEESQINTYTPKWSGQLNEEAVGYGSGAYGSLALQDTRGWCCHHEGSCNVLSADGSVHEYGDANGDCLVNPGFPIGPNGDPSIGYTDSQEDLPRTEIFSGIFISNVFMHPSRCHRN
jgi:type II secretory pathway pseudopilin PulG